MPSCGWIEPALGRMGPGRTPLARKQSLCLLSVTYCWVSNLLLCLLSHWVTSSISSVELWCFARDGVLLGPNTQPDGAPAPAWLQAELPGMLDFPAATLTCQIPPPRVYLQTHDAQWQNHLADRRTSPQRIVTNMRSFLNWRVFPIHSSDKPWI